MLSVTSLISSLPNLSLSVSGPAVPLKRSATPASSVWSLTPETRSPSPPAGADEPSGPPEEDEKAENAENAEKSEAELAAIEPDDIEVADWVQEYSDAKRLTPARANQLLEKAMGKDVPEPPDPDECCGSACCPCVKDLWLEEVGVWRAVRTGEQAEDVADKVFRYKK